MSGVGKLNLAWLGWGICNLLGWGGEFVPCLAGVGNLNRTVKSSQQSGSVVSLNMEFFQVNSLISRTNRSGEMVYKI